FGTDFSIVGLNCINYLSVVDNSNIIYYYSFDETNYFQNEMKIETGKTINTNTFVAVTSNGSKLAYPNNTNIISFYSNNNSGDLIVNGDLTVKGLIKGDYLTTEDQTNIELMSDLIPTDNTITLGLDTNRFSKIYTDQVVTPELFNDEIITVP